MKVLLVILIVALLMVGLTASVLPSPTSSPSYSSATPIDYTHSISMPGTVPQVAECDCGAGGC